MAVAQQIQESLRQLPATFHSDVLDFIQYLISKSARQSAEHELHIWSHFSLASALDNIEEDDDVLYDLADLKEVF